MAIYHLSIQIISRGKGKSAVAAAPYRAGEKIVNEFDGMVHDYTRKGGIVHTEILLPTHAPPEYSDRAALWNAVEKVEKNRNAQLAREVELALPAELSQAQNIALVRAYCQQHFVAAGMCADICVHEKKDGNPHAHILLTMRPFQSDNSWGAKAHKVDGKPVPTTDWNEQTKAEAWRSGWAEMCNAALERHGVVERVDHRSYERQGVSLIPTVHLGPAASAMEKRGFRTDLGTLNREAAVSNNEVRQLRGRIKKLQVWLYAQPLTSVPTIVETTQRVAAGKNLETRWQKVANAKTQAMLLNFLVENELTDLSQLGEKVATLHQSLYELGNEVKREERRILALNQHLAQVEIYRKHRAIYEKYHELAPKKREAFRAKHGEELDAYDAAKTYLTGVLNERNKIPSKAWREERETLLRQRTAHIVAYYKLKDDVRSIELLRKGAEEIMREGTAPQRTRQELAR